MKTEGRKTATLLLHAREGIAASEFHSRLASTAQATKQAEGTAEGTSRSDQRWSVLLPAAGRDPLPHEIFMAGGPKPAAAVIQVQHAGDMLGIEDLVAEVKKVLAEVESLVENDGSTVVYGDEVVIVPGYGPVYVMMQNRRAQGLTHQEHIDAWYGRHAQLGVDSGVAGYRQNHVDLDESLDLSRKLGLAAPHYDGVACSYFHSLDHAIEMMSSDLIESAAIPDEVTFIDHSRSTFGLYEDLRVDEL